MILAELCLDIGQRRQLTMGGRYHLLFPLAVIHLILGRANNSVRFQPVSQQDFPTI